MENDRVGEQGGAPWFTVWALMAVAWLRGPGQHIGKISRCSPDPAPGALGLMLKNDQAPGTCAGL